MQLALHLAINHQFSYPWVRGLADIALLARQQPVDWILVAERARVWRVAVPTWLALNLALSIVGLSEAQPALARLAPSPLRRRVLHLFVNPATLLQRRNITTGPLRFLFLLVTAQPGSENGLDSARSAPLPPNPGGAECFFPHGWGAGGPPEQILLLAIVDRPLAAARLLGRAVWPEEAWLAARYGTGGVRVRVRHTFDAMRGRL